MPAERHLATACGTVGRGGSIRANRPQYTRFSRGKLGGCVSKTKPVYIPRLAGNNTQTRAICYCYLAQPSLNPPLSICFPHPPRRVLRAGTFGKRLFWELLHAKAQDTLAATAQVGVVFLKFLALIVCTAHHGWSRGPPHRPNQICRRYRSWEQSGHLSRGASSTL